MQIRKKRGWNLKNLLLWKLLSQSQPNFAEMILRWSPFKIVSVSPVVYSKWSPLLKIEISSNGQNCSTLSQKVPKFELYKHDELFNIYYEIFYELWSFTDFDRLCKVEKKGDEIKKNLLLWNYRANLNQTLLIWSLGGPLSKLCPSAPSCIQKWSPLLKIEISSNGPNCSILSQKVPKFELFEHNDELFNIYYGIFLWTLNFYRFWPIMQIRKKWDEI